MRASSYSHSVPVTPRMALGAAIAFRQRRAKPRPQNQHDDVELRWRLDVIRNVPLRATVKSSSPTSDRRRVVLSAANKTGEDGCRLTMAVAGVLQAELDT